VGILPAWIWPESGGKKLAPTSDCFDNLMALWNVNRFGCFGGHFD
jgi:hypothetical protein